jgi:uncharacterized protein (TIGR02284 family)
MANPSTALRNVDETLRSIIVSLIDAQKGLMKLGECMKNSMVKRYFLAEALKRAEFREEIESMLLKEGMHDLIEGGSEAGVIYRAWIGLQAAMHEGDHALLITAVQAEGDTVQAYSDALESELPQPVRRLLSTQATNIKISLDCVRAMLASSR